MSYDDEIMHEVWSCEQEILDVFHVVCEKNHLKYTLFYGTLLGAVRHGGFIPWDDDIDILMPRTDYEKLLTIWDKEAPADYIMQRPEENPDYTNNFAKIRKNHTTFLEFSSESVRSYHKGIFVDIFPADKVPNGLLSVKVQYIFAAINLLYSRGYTSGSKGVLGFVERVLLSAPKRIYPVLRSLSEQVVKSWKGKKGLRYASFCTIKACKIFFPPDMFDHLTKIKFEGKDYYSVCETDKILTISYGNYMKLPPESERVWFHHPLLIDFENNFEDLPIEIKKIGRKSSN